MANSDYDKWQVTKFGMEQVKITDDTSARPEIERITDKQRSRVAKRVLYDTQDEALAGFKSIMDTVGNSVIKDRYESVKSKASDDELKSMFTILPKEETDFDKKLVQDAKDQTTIKSFFKDKMKSFDVEATGLDNSSRDFNNRARIWQVGLSVEGEAGIESHTNPLQSFLGSGGTKPNPMVQLINGEMKETLKDINGSFSQQTYADGGFDEVSRLHSLGRLPSLDTALKDTLGTVKDRDIIVIQNMNYEDSILRSSRQQGLISEDVYNDLLNNMYTTGDKSDGINSILQRPADVQTHMRRADLIFNTQYMVTGADSAYDSYMGSLNNAIASYKDVIDNPSRDKAVAVELQDITKYFLANAADKGHIPKNTSVLGLNIEFLAENILGEKETHTALSDATQTTTLAKKMMSMTDEIKTGTASTETLDILSNIKDNQPKEIDRGFLSSVASTINDFKVKGTSRSRGSFSFYAPEITLDEDGKKIVIPKTSTNDKPASITEALDNVAKRYNRLAKGSNTAIDRDNYIGDLKDQLSEHNNISTLYDKVDTDRVAFNSDKNIIPNTSDKITAKDLKPTNWKKVAAVAAGVGLAYMWATPDPGEKQKDYSSASEDYYNDQYMGTAFVDFKERNKHYMM